MVALHQIYKTQNNHLLIQLPESFSAYRQVEVIILPVDNNPPITDGSTTNFIQRFAGAIPDFPEIENLAVQEYEVML